MGTRSDASKRAQVLYYDRLAQDEAYIGKVIGPDDPFWGYLHTTVLERIASALGGDLLEKRVANVCCGTGHQAQYFSRLGAQVVGIDISSGQVRCAALRGQHHGLELDLLVADAEYLPLRSGSCEIGLAYEGLHHLSDPHRGIAELARVAAESIVFFEAVDVAATRLLVRLGLVDRCEPSGVEPYRFAEQELSELLAQLGFSSWQFYRYLWHNPSSLTHRFRHTRLGVGLFKLLFRGANKVFGHLGNRVVVVAWK
ncbi:MAG: class I SAM-dependent methyltransferase [Anaerolineae bacterium]